MISRYGIFCQVIETGNFTYAARQLGYSESSVSQSVKALERELGVTLINRKRGGLELTADGRQFYPYILSIFNAEKALDQKNREVQGLEGSTISLATFTGISRTILPPLMSSFQKKYPSVSFDLWQGEYNSIENAVREGSADLGFVIEGSCQSLKTRVLYSEPMMAVVPLGHPLSRQPFVRLDQLAGQPFILLDEGGYSVPLRAFEKEGLKPKVSYKVMDDYTILAMVRQGIGISMLYQNVLTGYSRDLAILPIENGPGRTVLLAWNNSQTLPLAAKKFARHILASMGNDQAGENAQ